MTQLCFFFFLSFLYYFSIVLLCPGGGYFNWFKIRLTQFPQSKKASQKDDSG